jgi:hypothetical protein
VATGHLLRVLARRLTGRSHLRFISYAWLLALLHFTIPPRSWIPILFSGRLAEYQMSVSQALISFVLLTSILIRIFLCPLQSQQCSHMFKEQSKIITKKKKICDGLRAYITSLSAPVTSSNSGRSSGRPRPAKPKPSPSFSVLHPLRPAIRFHLSSESLQHSRLPLEFPVRLYTSACHHFQFSAGQDRGG